MAAPANARSSNAFPPSRPDSFLAQAGIAFAATVLIYATVSFEHLVETLTYYTDDRVWSTLGALLYTVQVGRSAFGPCWLAHNQPFHSKVNRLGAMTSGRFCLYALAILTFIAFAAGIRLLEGYYEVVTREGSGLSAPAFRGIVLLLFVPSGIAILFDIVGATLLHPVGSWHTIAMPWRWFNGLTESCPHRRFVTLRLVLDVLPPAVVLAIQTGSGIGPGANRVLLIATVVMWGLSLLAEVVMHAGIYMQF